VSSIVRLLQPSKLHSPPLPMTIAAILDLEKVFAVIQSRIEPLLNPAALEEWNGSALKSQEDLIRALGLELAGHCIAILLHQLSEDPAVNQAAQEQTQTWRGFGSQSQGNKSVSVTTVGNVSVNLRTTYVLNRPSRQAPAGGKKARKRGQRGKSKGQGFYPLLRCLGLEEGVTPQVWSMVALFGMMSTSFAVAHNQLMAWGISLSLQRIERLTYRFAQIGVGLTEDWMQQLHDGTLPVGETLRDQRVVLQVDGGRTRIRYDKRGKPRKNGRRGYRGEWQEPKLFTLYAVDETGKRLNSLAIPVTNDGTFGEVESFVELLKMYLVKLGVVHAQQVLLVCDGAPWIWKRLPALLKSVGVAPENILELIDFYHATEHLRDFSEQVFSDKKQGKQWFKAACSRLKHKSIDSLLKQMQALMLKASKQVQQMAIAAFEYFSEQPERFRYSQIQAMKLPIGSGAIESLIRQVVNLRLKSSGKFWLPKHAELILYGRCQWSAGPWDVFAQSILNIGSNPSLPKDFYTNLETE
jgi:hypothetical protein